MSESNIDLTIIKNYLDIKKDKFLYKFLLDNKLIDEFKIENYYHNDLNEVIKNNDVFDLVINSIDYTNNDVLCFKLEVYSHFMNNISYFIRDCYNQLLLENNDYFEHYKKNKYMCKQMRSTLNFKSKNIMKKYKNDIFIDIKNILNTRNLNEDIINNFILFVKNHNPKDILNYDKELQNSIFKNDGKFLGYVYCRRRSDYLVGGYYHETFYVDDIIKNFSNFNYLLSQNFILSDNDPTLFHLLRRIIFMQNIYYYDKYYELINILQKKDYKFNFLFKKLNLLEYLNSIIFNKNLSRNNLMIIKRISDKFIDLGLKIQE